MKNCLVLLILTISITDLSAQSKKGRKPRLDTIRTPSSIDSALELIQIFDKDSNLRETGSTKNNLRMGSWKRYHKKTGIITRLSYYENDQLEGTRLTLDEDGRIKAEENFQNGQYHGIQKEYGTVWGSKIFLKAQRSYLQGELHGIQLEYRNDDKLMSESYYVKGLKEGWSRWYYSNGQISLEQQYKAGQFDGLQKAYYESGQFKKQGQYLEGKETGEWREFHESGEIKSVGNFKNGEKIGVWLFYTEEGKLERKERF